MKAPLLALSLLAAAALARAAEPAPPTVAIDPPPGWSDITQATPVKGVLLALRGPESSSFVVARLPATALDSAATTKSFLIHALDGLRAGAKLDYRSNGRVETKTFRNGVTARFLRATVDDQPRLVVAVIDAGGPPLLGTLSSAAADAMMGPLFGALRLGAPGTVRTAGTAQSTDGQLQLALGGGLRARDLSGEERRKNVVLAVQGAGSEVVFLKVEEEDASPKDQAAIVRATAADAAKVGLDSVSPAQRAPTPAGPAAVYAWAKISGTPDLRFAAGFLPWQYWGYSVLARGPQADELLVGALAALKQGPDAVAGLVAASPKIDVPDEAPLRRVSPGAVAAGILLLVLIVWSLGRKKG